MAINSKYNASRLTDGASEEKKNNNTYGSYVSGATPSLTPVINKPNEMLFYGSNISPAVSATTGANGGSNTYGSWVQNPPLIRQQRSPVVKYEDFIKDKVAYTGSKDQTETSVNEQSAQNNTPPSTLEEQRNKIYEAAEIQRQEAEHRAEVERERGIVDARSSYEQNIASYGANAEAMGIMGLSGSGYSDYLNTKAYTQQRAETQAANAQADASKREASYTENLSKLQADSEYYQGVEEKASYARAAYSELLTGANSGSYTAEQLEQLSKDYGLSDAQKQSLVNAANEYTTKMQAAGSANLYFDNDDLAGQIKAEYKSGAISKEQAQTHLYETYSREIDGIDTIDTSKIDKDYGDGFITDSQYSDLKKKWNDTIVTTQDAFYDAETGALMSKNDAKSYVDSYENHGWKDDGVYGELFTTFNKLYTPKAKGSNYNASNKELADDGNNFKVIIDGKKYHVESAGLCTEADVKDAANTEGINDGDMFGFKGRVFIKRNGNVYEVRKRKKSYQGDWDAVYAALCG